MARVRLLLGEKYPLLPAIIPFSVTKATDAEYQSVVLTSAKDALRAVFSSAAGAGAGAVPSLTNCAENCDIT